MVATYLSGGTIITNVRVLEAEEYQGARVRKQMYRQKGTPDAMKSASCPKCGSESLLYGAGKLTCRNCDHMIGKTFNKYGAKRTEFNGKIYDSKFEASVAQDLETRKRAKDIIDYDTQFKVEIPVYTKDGTIVHVVKHKVDFRVWELDGSFMLLEAKGVETTDYKWRRTLLEKIWLPEHQEYTYEVIKQNRRR